MGRAKNSLAATQLTADAFTSAVGGRRGIDYATAQQRARLEALPVSSAGRLAQTLRDPDEIIAAAAADQLAQLLANRDFDALTRRSLWTQLNGLPDPVAQPLLNALSEHLRQYGTWSEDYPLGVAYLASQSEASAEQHLVAGALQAVWSRHSDTEEKSDEAERLVASLASGNTALLPLAQALDGPDNYVSGKFANRLRRINRQEDTTQAAALFALASQLPTFPLYYDGAFTEALPLLSAQELQPVVTRLADKLQQPQTNAKLNKNDVRAAWSVLAHGQLDATQRAALLTALPDQPLDVRNRRAVIAALATRDTTGELDAAGQQALALIQADLEAVVTEGTSSDTYRSPRTLLAAQLAGLPSTARAQAADVIARVRQESLAVATKAVQKASALDESLSVAAIDQRAEEWVQAGAAAYDDAFRDGNDPEEELIKVLRQRQNETWAQQMASNENSVKRVLGSYPYETACKQTNRGRVTNRDVSSLLTKDEWLEVLTQASTNSPSFVFVSSLMPAPAFIVELLRRRYEAGPAHN